MFNIKKLKKLGYGDTISLKCNIVRPNLRYLEDRIYPSIREMEINDQYITYFFIDIYITNLDNDTDTKIGFLKGCYIQPEEFMDNCDFFDVCDAESQELSLMAENFVDSYWNFKEELADETDCICYISDFYIYKKFRNIGVGSYILDQLLDILYYYSRDFITKIILLPEPRVINNQRNLQNISDKNKDKEKLKKLLMNFYINNGFRKIENSEYLIKNIEIGR